MKKDSDRILLVLCSTEEFLCGTEKVQKLPFSNKGENLLLIQVIFHLLITVFWYLNTILVFISEVQNMKIRSCNNQQTVMHIISIICRRHRCTQFRSGKLGFLYRWKTTGHQWRHGLSLWKLESRMCVACKRYRTRVQVEAGCRSCTIGSPAVHQPGLG